MLEYDESIKGNIVDDNPKWKKYLVNDLSTRQIEEFVRKALLKEYNKGYFNDEIIGFSYEENAPNNHQVFRPASPVQTRQNDEGR